jgi:hypothetical protein
MMRGPQYFQQMVQYLLGLIPIICSMQSLILSTPKTQEIPTVWKKHTQSNDIPLAE